MRRRLGGEDRHGGGSDSEPQPLWWRRLCDEKKDRAPVEVAYAFYPGTGQRDLLEYNIVNAPLPPLWRERKPVVKHRPGTTPASNREKVCLGVRATGGVHLEYATLLRVSIAHTVFVIVRNWMCVCFLSS